MSMVVRSNINSMNANRNLSKNNSMVAKSIEKLASGYAINRAADDASGLAVSEKMRAQITGLEQGTSNTLEGIGLVQTAEGAMEEIHNMLNRMVELATKSANGTIQDEVDREAIQAEVDALVIEIDRIAESTNFNGIPLLMGLNLDTVIKTVTEVQTFTKMEWDATGLTKGTFSTSYTAAYLDVSSGVDSTNSTYSGTYYKSDPIDLATGATSVPSGNSLNDSDLPYVITMEIVSYSETSTGGVGTTTLSLTVSKNDDGSYSVKDQNGVEYIGKTITTNYDDKNGLTGYSYISDFENQGITESEMTIIMENVLNYVNNNGITTDFNAGGTLYLNYTWSLDDPNTKHLFYDDNGDLYYEYNEYSSNPSPYFQNGEGYGDYVSASYYKVLDCSTITSSSYSEGKYVSPQTSQSYVYWSDYYNEYRTTSTSTTATYSTAYVNGMSIYGGSGYTNTGRVLGVVSTVTQGGVVTDSVGSPSGFDVSQWDSTTDLTSLSANTILGIEVVGETTRSEIEIPEPVSNADVAGMTDEQLQDLIVTIKQTTDIYPSYPYDYPDGWPEEIVDYETVVIEKKYVTVYSDFVDTEPSMFGDDVLVIYGGAGDKDDDIIDKLCTQITSDFGIDRVNRKLDDATYDIPTDPNITNKYTLQIGTYSQTRNTWKTQPTIDGDIELFGTEVEYQEEVTYQKEVPVDVSFWLHVADENQEYNKVYIYIDPMTGEALEIKPLYVDTQEEAGVAIEKILNAINYVSENRANLGAIQNRLEKIINVNNNTSENMSSALSVIKDTDMASEMMQYTTLNVLVQSAQAMLAQSNAASEQILSLLG